MSAIDGKNVDNGMTVTVEFNRPRFPLFERFAAAVLPADVFPSVWQDVGTWAKAMQGVMATPPKPDSGSASDAFVRSFHFHNSGKAAEFIESARVWRRRPRAVSPVPPLATVS